MKEEQHIDRIVREKLEGFTEEPPAFIWTGISEQMNHARQRNRRAWYSWSAVAALLMLAFVAGWYLNQETSPAGVVQSEPVKHEREVVQERTATVVQPTAEKDVPQEEPNEQLLAGATERKRETAPAAKEQHRESISEPVKPSRVDLAFFRPLEPAGVVLVAASQPVTDEPLVQHERTDEVAIADREIIASNALARANIQGQEEKWKLGMNISPGYSSHTASHSQVYASNMTREATDGNSNLSGGISVRYKTGKRWNVESGVYYAQNGQKTGSSPQLFAGRRELMYDAAPVERHYFNTAVTMANNVISLNSTAGVIAIETMPAGAEIAANLESSAGFENSFISQGEFAQVFDFVEVPLYLRYLLLGSRVNVELIGGINAGFIIGNNAYLDNQFGKQHIGKTSDISTLNFSGTMGIGLTYNLGKRVSFAVEPRVNYYLSSISRNDEVDFRPYRLGVYTGLYYAF